MQAVSYLRNTLAVQKVIHMGVTKLISYILSLKENVDVPYENLRIVANHKVNPLIIPPAELYNILVKVKHDMRINPRPELPDDLDRNIWQYFFYHERYPCGLIDFLLVFLTIQLIN